MSDQNENQDVDSSKPKTVVNDRKMSEETMSKVKRVADNLKNKTVDFDKEMLKNADKLAGTLAEQGYM